jgi:hypothetical protein
MTILTRQTAGTGVSAKNAPLTHAELDSNFIQLTQGKLNADSIIPAVTAASLHRSPNAITAMFVYDTSKDSDGGAWTEKCKHTSWYQEAINNLWLGAYASEALARAAGGTTGDYYQLTTDGKFYSLSAGSGQVEVFRGNKRDFPRLAGLVAEAGNLTIYDLTEPGRPMWKRLLATAVITITNRYALSGCSSIVATQGKIYCGGSATNLVGLTTLDFAKDSASVRFQYTSHTWNGNLATANTIGGYTTNDASLGLIPNAIVNAVAATVLPDAPLDPVTGLKVPTIACLPGDSLVRMSDGTDKRIDEIQTGDFVKTLEGNHQVLNFFDQGIKDVIELTFDDGKKLTCTPDHKIRTTIGWVEAGFLTENHEIIAL